MKNIQVTSSIKLQHKLVDVYNYPVTHKEKRGKVSEDKKLQSHKQVYLIASPKVNI